MEGRGAGVADIAEGGRLCESRHLTRLEGGGERGGGDGAGGGWARGGTGQETSPRGNLLDFRVGDVELGLRQRDLVVGQVVDDVGGAQEGVAQDREVLVRAACDAELARVRAVREGEGIALLVCDWRDEFGKRYVYDGAPRAAEAEAEDPVRGRVRAGDDRAELFVLDDAEAAVD